MFKVTETEAKYAVVVVPLWRPQDARIVGWYIITYIIYVWQCLHHPSDDVIIYGKE